MLQMPVTPVQIGLNKKTHYPLGLGCWSFGQQQWMGRENENLLKTMEAAEEHDITHFDTATGYGDGYSESLIGRFIGRHEEQRWHLETAAKFNCMIIAIQDIHHRILSGSLGIISRCSSSNHCLYVLNALRAALFVLLSGGQMGGLTTVCLTCYADWEWQAFSMRTLLPNWFTEERISHSRKR
jgi:predicted aldo/keto reductase-like oxidoreductase